MKRIVCFFFWLWCNHFENCDGLADESSFWTHTHTEEKNFENKNSPEKNLIINVKNPIKFNDQSTFQR